MKEFISEDGRIRLYNMDCMDYLKQCKENEFDIAFTSPPYNRKRNDKYANYNDDNPDWYNLITTVATELLRVCRRHVFYNIQANYYNRSDLYKFIGNFHDKIIDIHIWEKQNPLPANGFVITNAVEYFIVLGNQKLESNKTYTKNIVSTSVSQDTTKDHKAVMSIDVAKYFLSTFAKEGDKIIDPFVGLNTTGIVCSKFNYEFSGTEISEDYFKMAVERTKNETAQTDMFGGQ